MDLKCTYKLELTIKIDGVDVPISAIAENGKLSLANIDPWQFSEFLSGLALDISESAERVN